MEGNNKTIIPTVKDALTRHFEKYVPENRRKSLRFSDIENITNEVLDNQENGD